MLCLILSARSKWAGEGVETGLSRNWIAMSSPVVAYGCCLASTVPPSSPMTCPWHGRFRYYTPSNAATRMFRRVRFQGRLQIHTTLQVCGPRLVGPGWSHRRKRGTGWCGSIGRDRSTWLLPARSWPRTGIRSGGGSVQSFLATPARTKRWRGSYEPAYRCMMSQNTAKFQARTAIQNTGCLAERARNSASCHLHGEGSTLSPSVARWSSAMTLRTLRHAEPPRNFSRIREPRKT